MKITDYTLLLVGDVIDETENAADLTIFDEDNPTNEEVGLLVSYLIKAGFKVEVQTSVDDFVSHPPKGRDAIVFPLWRGGPSRNRTVIVPAVCESQQILYVGSDAFVQAACQDKSLSKALAIGSGLAVPKEIVLYAMSDLEAFHPADLTFPVVLKPLYSACSIGINEDSCCFTEGDAMRRATELFEANLGPVLCEEFIQGDEISLCYYEKNGEIIDKCVAIYLDENGVCPFKDRLFTFEDKLNPAPPWSIALWDGQADEALWRQIKTLNKKLGKVDYMRIDGRMHNGKFVLLELTPDIHLSLASSFLGGFDKAGMPPDVLLKNIIEVAVENALHAKSPVTL